jgi:hypothetical protein
VSDCINILNSAHLALWVFTTDTLGGDPVVYLDAVQLRAPPVTGSRS